MSTPKQPLPNRTYCAARLLVGKYMFGLFFFWVWRAETHGSGTLTLMLPATFVVDPLTNHHDGRGV